MEKEFASNSVENNVIRVKRNNNWRNRKTYQQQQKYVFNSMERISVSFSVAVVFDGEQTFRECQIVVPSLDSFSMTTLQPKMHQYVSRLRCHSAKLNVGIDGAAASNPFRALRYTRIFDIYCLCVCACALFPSTSDIKQFVVVPRSPSCV